MVKKDACCRDLGPESPGGFSLLSEFISANRHKEGYLIPVLHAAQGIFGHLPAEVQEFVAREMSVPPGVVRGVVTFYSYFREQPVGRHIVTVCLGTACYVRGARKVLEALEKELGIRVGGTTSDRRFSLGVQRCLGACGLAPAVMVGKEVYGRVSARKIGEILARHP